MGKSYMEYRIMAYEDCYGRASTWVYKEFETKAEVKSYLRHFNKEFKYEIEHGMPLELWVEARQNDEDYGPQSEWINLTDSWSHRAQEEIEEWCERKGIDYGKVFGWG